MPPYLMCLVEDYFSQRMPLYDTTVRRRYRPSTGSIAQDSLEGPELRGIRIDGLLRMALPEGITLVGYVNDATAIIVPPDLNTAQIKTEIMMRRVAQWMGKHGLQLALAKTEIVILSWRRIGTIVPIRIGDQVMGT